MYTGEPYALALNAKILKRLSSISAADLQNKVCMRPDRSGRAAFAQWLALLRLGLQDQRLTPAGKNFSSFDKNFLDQLPGWKETVKLNHRALDPAVILLAAG